MLYKNDPRPSSKDIYIVDDGGLLRKAGELNNRGQVYLAVRGILHNVQAAAYTSITDHDIVRWATHDEVPNLGLEELAVFETPIASGTYTGIQFSEAQFTVDNMVDYAGFEPLIVTWTKMGDGGIRTGSPVDLEYPPNQTTQQYCVQVSTVDLTIRSPVSCITLIGIQPENINLDNMVIEAKGACDVPNYTKEFISNNELKISGVTSSDGDLNFELVSITKAISPNAGVAIAGGMRWKPINTMETALIGAPSHSVIRVWLDNSTRSEIVEHDTIIGTIGHVDVTQAQANLSIFSSGPRFPTGMVGHTVGEVIEEEATTVTLSAVPQSGIPFANMLSLTVHMYQENTNDPNMVRVAEASDPLITIGAGNAGITSAELVDFKYIVTKLFLNFGSCTGRNEHLTLITEITEDMPEDINLDNLAIVIGDSCDGPNFVKDVSSKNHVSLKGVTSSDGILEYSITSITDAAVGAGQLTNNDDLTDPGWEWDSIVFNGGATLYSQVVVTFKVGLFESIHNEVFTRTVRLDNVGSVNGSATAASITHHTVDEPVNVVIEDTHTEFRVGDLVQTGIESVVLNQARIHYFQEQANSLGAVRDANITDPVCVPGQQTSGADTNMVDHGSHLYTNFYVEFVGCPERDVTFGGGTPIILKQPTDINIDNMSFEHGGSCPVASSDMFAIDSPIDNWFEMDGVTSSDGIVTYNMQTLLEGGGGGLKGTGYRWQEFGVSGNEGDMFTVTILLGLVDSTFTKQVTAQVELAIVGRVLPSTNNNIEVHSEDLDVPEIQATLPSLVKLTAIEVENIPLAALSGAVLHLYQEQTYNTANVRDAHVGDTVIQFNYDSDGMLLLDLDVGNRLVTHILVSFPACPSRNYQLENIEEITAKPPEDINLDNMEFKAIGACGEDKFAEGDGNRLELTGITSSDGTLTYEIDYQTSGTTLTGPLPVGTSSNMVWGDINASGTGTFTASVTVGLVGGTVTEVVTVDDVPVESVGTGDFGVITVHAPGETTVMSERQVEFTIGTLTSATISQADLDTAVGHFEWEQTDDFSAGTLVVDSSSPTFNITGVNIIPAIGNLLIGERFNIRVAILFPSCTARRIGQSYSAPVTFPPPEDINLSGMVITFGEACVSTAKMDVTSPTDWMKIDGVTSSDGILEYTWTVSDGIGITNGHANDDETGWVWDDLNGPAGGMTVGDIYNVTIRITLEGGTVFEDVQATYKAIDIGTADAGATMPGFEYRSEGETIQGLILENTFLEMRVGEVMGTGLSAGAKASVITRYVLDQVPGGSGNTGMSIPTFDDGPIPSTGTGWLRVGWVGARTLGSQFNISVAHMWPNCPVRETIFYFIIAEVTENPIQANYEIETSGTYVSLNTLCSASKNQYIEMENYGTTVQAFNGSPPSSVEFLVEIDSSTIPITSSEVTLANGLLSNFPCYLPQSAVGGPYPKYKVSWNGSSDNGVVLKWTPRVALDPLVKGVPTLAVSNLQAADGGSVVSFTVTRDDGLSETLPGNDYSFTISNVVTNPAGLDVEFALFDPFPHFEGIVSPNFSLETPDDFLPPSAWSQNLNPTYTARCGGKDLNTATGSSSGGNGGMIDGGWCYVKDLGVGEGLSVPGDEYRGYEDYTFILARTIPCAGSISHLAGQEYTAYTKRPVFRQTRNRDFIDVGPKNHMAMGIVGYNWDNDPNGSITLSFADLTHISGNKYRWNASLDCSDTAWDPNGWHGRVQITTREDTDSDQVSFVSGNLGSPAFSPYIGTVKEVSPPDPRITATHADNHTSRSFIAGLHPKQQFTMSIAKPANGSYTFHLRMHYQIFGDSSLRFLSNTGARRITVHMVP